MRRFIAIILLLSTMLLASCNTVPENTDETTAATTVQEPEPSQSDDGMTLVKNGKSEYVIICNFKDSTGRAFANTFSDFMYTTFGVSFDIKSESSSYDKEIIIGDTSREATLSIKAQMKQDGDFAVCAVDDDLVLYATDSSQYGRLLVALRDYVFAGTDTSELKYNNEKNFIASLNPDMVFGGVEVLFMDNYKTSYSIVYKDGDMDAMTYAIYLKQYLNEVFGITVPIQPDTKQTEKEIVLKGANRAVLKTAEQKLEDENDFLVQVVGDDILISATDSGKMILAMMRFVAQGKDGFNGTQVKLSENDNYVHSKAQNSFEYSAKELCERYQSIYNTYSSYHEEKLHDTSWLPQSARADQKLVTALIDRMGKSFAVYNGSSSVLYDGFVRKLDTTDYTRAAVISGQSVKIPKQFAESYFGTTLTADSNGYVDITSYLSGNSKYSIYISGDGKLAIITHIAVAPFTNGVIKVGEYTNAQYCNRMVEFFNSAIIPEPTVNTEQSRVVIEHIPYPEYVLDYTTNVYQTTYSPGIIVVKEGGNSVYYVSYEVSTVRGGYEELDTYTVVKKSTDGGNTWTVVVEKIPGLIWASIFENNGTIYLLGGYNKTYDVMIVKVNSNGTFETSYLFNSNSVAGSAPGVVLHAYGRVYKAYSNAVISAPENSDLMNPSSWTASNRTDNEELALRGGEGSMILGKDGQIYQVSRGPTTQTVYLLKVSADGTIVTGAKPSTGNVIEFPTCITKTSVRYDAVSGKYIALANVCYTENGRSVSERQRNVLALVVSNDLYNWTIAEYILVEREMINPVYSMTCHAFQYADFDIDGDDIVMAIRETAGYTNTYHDGNYTTFYRLENFRELLNNDQGDYGN